MPVPFPDDDEVLLTTPDEDEVAFLSRGLGTAPAPPGGLRPLQVSLIEAVAEAMTGHPADPRAALPIGPREFAEGLARRPKAFRTRIVQVMLLAALVLVPLPDEVVDQVAAFADELGVDDDMLRVAHRYARGSLGLALIDFERSGYSSLWTPEDTAHLHTSHALDEAWQLAVHDPQLAAQWASLEELAPGTLGRAVADFYRARGFVYPGRPGSAPPLLAQHDWVHVLADYGTSLECELEVFAFIARANADPRAFSLVAMVVSLFETGYLSHAAGLFDYDRGHLSRPGMTGRLADGMRRGAQTVGEPDFLRLDWFELADRPVEEVRRRFGVVPKSAGAVAAGSVGPWEPGGISPFQLAAGKARAEAEGRAYDAFGAA